MSTVLEHEGYRITVSPESDPLNPREWDNLGIITAPRQGKYSLADKGHAFSMDDFNTWDEVEADIRVRGGVLIFPLSLYDHGGISIYIGKNVDRWDGSRVGFIYATAEDIYKEGLTIEQAEAILRGEINSYDKYLRGDIYTYQVEENRKSCTCGECSEWVVVDSCGGWELEEDAITEAKQVAEFYAKKVGA